MTPTPRFNFEVSTDSHSAGTIIPLTRVAIDPATGVPGHPATAINTITGWLDGSMVYGSSKATADSLRLPDGHMKTSAGGRRLGR